MAANFVCTASAAAARATNSSARYRYKLRRAAGGMLKIAERRAILDAEELGTLGSVSFIL